MKKSLLIITFILVTTLAYGQAYHPIRIAPLEYNTHTSHVGIKATITPATDGSYDVVLYNSNRNDDGCRTSYYFTWYLSYKGKKVSDYYENTIGCGASASVSIYAWPNEVPQGYEKYVTVQFGRYKDRRDDDY